MPKNSKSGCPCGLFCFWQSKLFTIANLKAEQMARAWPWCVKRFFPGNNLIVWRLDRLFAQGNFPMAKKAAEHPKRYLMGIFYANRAAEIQALIRSLEEALGAHSEGKCRVEFVDVMEQAERAMLQLFVTPMLVKELPATAGC